MGGQALYADHILLHSFYTLTCQGLIMSLDFCFIMYYQIYPLYRAGVAKCMLWMVASRAVAFKAKTGQPSYRV